MTTKFLRVVYEGIMSLEEGQERIIELDTGAKITLTFRRGVPYICFQSKNPKMKELGFWGYIINGKIKHLESFEDFWYFEFKKLTSLKTEEITEWFRLGEWSFEEGCITTPLDQIKVTCNTWEQGIKDLIAFYKELTLLITGFELDDNLAIIKEG